MNFFGVVLLLLFSKLDNFVIINKFHRGFDMIYPSKKSELNGSKNIFEIDSWVHCNKTIRRVKLPCTMEFSTQKSKF